jgi:hypothetical protein
MKDMFPVAALLGGVACIIIGQAFTGIILCIAAACVYEDDKGGKE